MNELTLIFVSFNSSEALSKSLQPLVSDPALRILVIDNGSSDGTVAQLNARFPGVETIGHHQNLGYGRAANVGLRMATTPFALLLNPDVLTTAGDVRRLLSRASHCTINAAIWGPATRKKEHTGQPLQIVNRIRGSAMLFDVKKIKEIGLFDENIFLYAEEDELCDRTFAAGYSVVACRDVYFEHLGGKSSLFNPRMQYMKCWHFGWSRCYCMSKQGTTLYRNPLRKYITYRIHSLLSPRRAKRAIWNAKSDGALAFVRGEKAFRPDGTPQMS